MEFPLVTYIGNDQWRLERDFQHGDIKIPAGFEFDLASIPRPLWNVGAPFELSLTAPLIHDYLYRHGGWLRNGRWYTRKETDDLFNEIMKDEGVAAWRRVVAYRAVRLFGGSSWHVAREARAA